MRLTLSGLAVLLVFCLQGCSEQPLEPDVTTAPPPPTQMVTPPIRGYAREANGGPLVGIQVNLGERSVASAVSDAAGSFLLPSTPCPAGSSGLTVRAFNVSFEAPFPSLAKCVSNVPAPQEFALELKLQRWIHVIPGRTLQTVITNDALDLPQDSPAPACGPCASFAINGSAARARLRITWSAPVELRAWLFDPLGATRLRAELSPVNGAREMSVDVDDDPDREWPLFFRVGLPLDASRQRLGELPGPIDVRVDYDHR